MLVQPLRLIGRDARRDDLRFPGARRRFVAFEQTEYRRQRIGSLHSRLRQYSLPFAEKPHEIPGLHRFDLGAQALDRVAMNAREQPAFAPLLLGLARAWRAARACRTARAKPAAHGKALGLEPA